MPNTRGFRTPDGLSAPDVSEWLDRLAQDVAADNDAIVESVRVTADAAAHSTSTAAEAMALAASAASSATTVRSALALLDGEALAATVEEVQAVSDAAAAAAETAVAPTAAAVAAVLENSGTAAGAMLAGKVGRGEQIIVPTHAPYNAVGDGVANDTVGLQAAVNAAVAAGLPLYIPKGTFKVTAPIQTNGSLTVYGPGTILSAHNVGPTLQVRNATGGGIRDITIQGTGAVRDAVSRCLQIKDSSGVRVAGVTMKAGASAGLFIENCSNISVTDNTVRDTLADGIHISKKSTGVSVIGNKVINPGDDCIAVVSYVSDGGICSDVTITGNNVEQGKARGITVAGGNSVTITGNTIKSTASSGVILVKDTTFDTYAVADVVVADNTILDAGQRLPRIGNQSGVEVASGVSRARVSGNIIRNPYQKGVAVSSSGTGVTDNTISQAGQEGVSVGASRVSVLGNIIEDSARYAVVTSAAGLSDITVSDNTISGSNTSAAAGIDSINIGASGAVANAVVIGNSIMDTAVRTERAIEMNANGGILRGNTTTGVTAIGVVGGSNIERDQLTSATPPTSTFYKAGTSHLDTATNKLHVYTGAGGWKSVTLT